MTISDRGIINNHIDENYTLYFPKKSNSSGISWISKEQYLRNDITCKYIDCKKCKPYDTTGLISFNYTSSNKDKLIIIPDIKTIVEYLEIFEINTITETPICNVIILESVYRYVQYNSGQKFFERLKSLLKNSKNTSRGICFFSNELFSQTFQDRVTSDSFQMHQYRTIVKSCQWFRDHLQDDVSNIKVQLVTQDVDLQSFVSGVDKSISSITLLDYLQSRHSKNKELLNLYDSITQLLIEQKQQQQQQKDGSNTSEQFYERYLNDDILSSELKSGSLFQGKIHVNQHNRDEAFIKIQNQTVTNSDKILIIGKKNINRSVHGDSVAVQLLPESEWLPSLNVDDIDDSNLNDNDGEMKVSKLGLVPTGRVVGIVSRNWRDYVGTMEKDTNMNSSFVFIIPFDYRIPAIRVPTRNPQMFQGKRVIIRLDSWDLHSNYPTGHYVSDVGESGSLETELQSLLIEHDISLSKWSQQILESLPKSTVDEPWPIPKEEFDYRRVLKDHHTMSIDPLGSKDIDDAISVGYLDGDNLIEIGVHIADVSFFVKEGSALDIEAARRGTTIYLPDRRFDMLPAVLSEDVCSLRGGFPRCAMSTIWKIKKNSNGGYEIVDTWFGRTIIYSCAEMHYQLAQDIIDGVIVQGKDKDSDVTGGGQNAGYKNRLFQGIQISQLKKDLLTLVEVFRYLKKQRESVGALDLESIEVRFQFDKQTNQPEKIVLKKDLEIHQVVAEFMILANASVATKIHSHFPSCALLRRHPKPNPIQLESLRYLFDLCGFQYNYDSNKELAKSLHNATDKQDHYKNIILKLKAVNVISEAIYFSTGQVNVSEFYHYGLAIDKYTHFTSPIRRYADIIVHRQLWMSLGHKKVVNYDDYKMNELSNHLNHRHRASKTVQRDATELFQSMYFQWKPKDNVEAIVTDLRSNSLVVYVPEYGLRQRVYLLKNQEVNSQPMFSDDNQPVRIEINESNVVFHLKDQTKITIYIFDHVLVRIYTEQNQYHMAPIKLELTKVLTKSQHHNSAQQNRLLTDNKKNLINETKELSKLMSIDQSLSSFKSNLIADVVIDLTADEKQLLQNNSNSVYNLIKKFSVLDIKETGSKINYSHGKSKSIVNSNLSPVKNSNQDASPTILKLWSMTEKETKEYKTRSDRYLRDSITKKYIDQSNIVESDFEKISPSLSVKDKYSNVISKAENDFRKSTQMKNVKKYH
ncbi:putative mitotic control protein [Tieghemostelium lacteum]|uniref:DIS3-like exonuclease 1 n=1 Tax=Tieghemostelium lacteum TaxID=361077 RepID=A0A152A414_TIELA|nr:putative mitotic control protein [Tieghemostelium lacteum]|eukprot:KYR01012.1 putative mitotic control protein [Tieghemostelium lacteum]